MKKGEIGLTLTIFSLLVILIGTIVGSNTTQKHTQKTRTSASESECDYDSVSQIRINGVVAENIPGFSWVSDGYGDTTIHGEGTFPPDNPDGTGKLETPWRPRPLPMEFYRNKHAKTTVVIPTGYRIISTFCENDTLDICKNTTIENDNATIGNILMACDGKLTYGWNVEQVQPTLTPTIETTLSPTPTTQPSTCFFNPVAQINVEFAKGETAPNFGDGKWGLINDKTIQTYGDISSKWNRFEGSGGIGIFAACWGDDPINGCRITGDTCCGPVGNGYSIRRPEGDKADVTLHYDKTKYKITHQCFGANTSALKECRSVETETNPEIFKDLPVKCNESYTYSWSLKSFYSLTPSPTVTPTTTPTNSPATPTPDEADNCMLGRNCYQSPPPEGWNKSCKLRDVIGHPNNELILYCCPEGEKGPTKCRNTCPLDKIRTQDGSCISATDTLCKKVKGDGKHKILFVTENSSETDLDNLIENTVKEMEQSDLGSLASKLSYYKYDKSSLDMWCSQSPVGDSVGGDAIICDGYDQVNLLKQTCGADTVIIESKYVGRSTAGYGIVNLEKTAWSRIISHELGHAIPVLGDEYDRFESTDTTSPYKNCTENSVLCNQWKSKYGNKVSCVAGCSYANWHRSTENSIMRYHHETNFFYDVNLEEWKTALNQQNDPNPSPSAQRFQGLDAKNIEDPVYHNSILVNLSQYEYGKLKVKNVSTVNVYPENNNNKIQVKGYRLNVTDSKGQVIYQTNIDAYQLGFDMPENKLKKLKPQLLTYLPFYNNASQISIENDSNEEVVKFSLSDYRLTKPITPPRNSLCGNSVCDSRIGENNSSCVADCAPKETKVEKNIKLFSSDVDKNKYVNAIDFAIVIKNYGKKYETGVVPADTNKDGVVNAKDSSSVLMGLGIAVNQ